jgi:hypothetical protein
MSHFGETLTKVACTADRQSWDGRCGVKPLLRLDTEDHSLRSVTFRLSGSVINCDVRTLPLFQHCYAITLLT